MSSMLTGPAPARAQSGSGSCGRPSVTPVRQYSARGRVGDLGRLAAVVALVRHEVLQDDLLDVAVLGVQRGEGLQRLEALLLGLADPDEDSAGEGDFQLARDADRLQALLRVLARRAGVDGVHQPLGDRLEHQSLRGGHLAQPREVLALEHAQVGVWQQAPLERALARPCDIRGEVLMAV